METLFNSLNFLFGTLSACALVLTGWVVIRTLFKFFDDNEKDKQIHDLKKEINDLKYRLETKTEIEKMRYYRERLTNKK